MHFEGMIFRKLQYLLLCLTGGLTGTCLQAQESALELIAPDTVRFVVHLSGPDEGISDVHSSRHFFEHLEPGKYSVEIKIQTPCKSSVNAIIHLQSKRKVTHVIRAKRETGGACSYALSLRSESEYVPSTNPLEMADAYPNGSVQVDLPASDTATGSLHPGFPVPVYDGVKGCASPMSETAFFDWLEKIREWPFEHQKLQAARNGMANRCLLSKQVRELLEIFDFEDYKVTLAKVAYLHTWDQDNFQSITDAFLLACNKEELRRFLSQKYSP